jgi:hypothetical protein
VKQRAVFGFCFWEVYQDAQETDDCFVLIALLWPTAPGSTLAQGDGESELAI